MDDTQQNRRSHLFLVRLWLDREDASLNEGFSHGKVQHLITGKASNFSDWTSLIDLFASMVYLSQAVPSTLSSIANKADTEQDDRAGKESCEVKPDDMQVS